ncbi:MAG: tetratricopeptide repeat protein [Spirochaetia bacterium]|nr:tetratricopeptide repeat protein [Spirochaetia bacterium]
MEKKMKHKEVLKMLKRNEAQEFATGIAGFFSKNTENFIIVAVVVVVIAVAIPLYLNSRAQANVRAEQALSEANYYTNRPVLDDPQAQMYGFFRTKKEKYEKAQSAYGTVLQNYKNSSSTPAAYMGLANAYFNNGQYKEALEYFNTFVEKYPKHAMTADAICGRAYANLQLGQIGEAVKDLELVLNSYKGGSNINDTRLKLAEAYLKSGSPDKAGQMCEAVIKESKDSYWMSLAGGILAGIK